MKLKKIRFSCLILLISLFLLPINIYSETTKTENIFEFQNGPVTITSLSFDFDIKARSFSYSGGVNVTMGYMEMSCQDVKLFLNLDSEDAAGKEIGADPGKIEKIVATGSVVIDIPDKGKAIAEKAEFYYGSEKIILSGKPSITMLMEGNKVDVDGGQEIIWYVNDDKIQMKGSADGKVKSIFQPAKD